MAALTAAIDNPNQEMVDEAKRKVAELNLITAELRELHTKRDN
jgi:trans-aconitate methyltransferase